MPAQPGAPAVLQQIDESVGSLYEMVREALAGATETFLVADRTAARKLVRQDQVIDELHRRTEQMVMDELLRPGAFDRYRREERHRLLLVLRILPELERSGDLAEHIATHAAQDLAQWLSPRARKLVAGMGAVGTEMWVMAAEAFERGDGSIADALRDKDDEIDDLHVSLTAELAAARVSIPVAIEMALVARYFERLGDHAVNVTRRVQAMNLALAGDPEDRAD